MSNNHDDQILERILTYLEEILEETRESIYDDILQGKEHRLIMDNGRLDSILTITGYVTRLNNKHTTPNTKGERP